MKQKLMASFGILFCLWAIPMTVWADSARWNPPAEKGTIYIIFRYRQGFGPQPTNVSIRWGRWSLNETFSPPKKLLLPGSGIPEGFVISLKHSKNDSVQLEIETNGTISRYFQGNSPSECNRGEYKCYSR